MKRSATLFAIFWAGIFLLSFITSKDLPLFLRIACSAGLACVPLVLSLSNKENWNVTAKNRNVVSKTKRSTVITVHSPNSSRILYRVEGTYVYEGMAASPQYEIRDNKIYPLSGAKPAFRIDGSNIYKGMEISPIFIIKGNKIYKPLSNQVVYEVHKK